MKQQERIISADSRLTMKHEGFFSHLPKQHHGAILQAWAEAQKRMAGVMAGRNQEGLRR